MKDFSFSLPLLTISLISLLLSACGGAPLNNPDYLAENGLDRRIAVTLAGSSGDVSISLGDNTVSFTEDGTQVVGGFFPDEEVSAAITVVPEGQECFFSPSNLTEIIASDQVNITCGVPGVSGSIKNFFTGDAIAGASITVSQYAGDVASEFSSTTSDAQGNYVVEDTIAGNRYVVTVSASGFSTQSVIGLPTAARPFVTENIAMVPQNGTDSSSPSGAMSFVVGGITALEIPANGLERADASAPVGDVTARLTLIEPSAGVNALPGRYEYDSGAGINFIEAFGGLGVILTDSEGVSLSLVDGVSATVRVPVATRVGTDAPDDAFVYIFEEGSGYWSTETAAVLTTSGGVDVYESSVGNLSEVIASGQAYSTVQISGCIEDSSGNSVVEATIVVQGSSFIGSSYGVGDASGNFSVPARVNSSVFVYGLVGARSRTVSTATTTSDVSLGECIQFDLNSTVIELTWGEEPRDLDSRLFGPNGSGGRFNVYYGLREVTINSVTMFLDVDDVTSFGPEVTTIPRFPLAGTYEFFVHLFSGDSDITSSPARVELNVRGENFAFSPPASGATRCWHVFNIEVDSALQPTVIPTNVYISDESACNVSGLLSTDEPGGETLQKPSASAEVVSPGAQAIIRKYYAE